MCPQAFGDAGGAVSASSRMAPTSRTEHRLRPQLPGMARAGPGTPLSEAVMGSVVLAYDSDAGR